MFIRFDDGSKGLFSTYNLPQSVKKGYLAISKGFSFNALCTTRARARVSKVYLNRTFYLAAFSDQTNALGTSC